MDLTYKKRSIQTARSGHALARITYYDGNGLPYGQSNTIDNDLPPFPSGDQVTGSLGHPWKSRNKGDQSDIGGDFITTKRTLSIPGADGSRTWEWSSPTRANPVPNNWHERYLFKGPLYATDPRNCFPVGGWVRTPAQLDIMGATAIARCQPTNSIADASTFLGELLKDGLPTVPGIKAWEAKADLARKAGDEFLNVVFGWGPLTNDIRKTAKAVNHARSVLRQFERDAGRVVRRSYVFPTETSESTQKIASNVVPWYGTTIGFPSTYLDRGDVWLNATFRRRVWFSGAFTYHLPSGYKSREAMDRIALGARKVFGLELTPEVVWELTPWSWAVDWVTNAGDVLKNLSAWSKYGLVMKYGYVMEHSTTTYTWYFRRTGSGSPTYEGKPIGSSPMPITTVTEVKQRRQANPFGFGVTWSGLSPIQNAILAALGLSRH